MAKSVHDRLGSDVVGREVREHEARNDRRVRRLGGKVRSARQLAWLIGAYSSSLSGSIVSRSRRAHVRDTEDSFRQLLSALTGA
ncbi:hypothetical protein [Kribbella sp. VKM Ac-2571]|uniref:hypothetical protein n=1 Tax=Kribbella sp. VKM Ac-2571 TaxID=2512222 RepID=UPI00105DBF0C|nr:hypothetical protein [Kribbella sp. VKM Ac-2571]